jgi:hypothetical protein
VYVLSGFPWNSSNQSRSAELINPALDNNYNSNWQATANPNQYLANTSGFQNTRFDPMGLTCQDSTACNYDPFIESEAFNCDYTCFWPDATLDNDASNSPVVLNDGSTLRLGRSEMFSGNSMPQTQCAVGYNDAWFELNTRNYDTVQVSLNFINNMPSIGCDIYRRVNESLMPVTCFTFSASTVLNFHDDVNKSKLLLESYTSVLVNFQHVTDYYKQISEKNALLKKKLYDLKADITTNDRKSYYEDQGIESLNFYYYIFLGIYLLILVVFIICMFLKTSDFTLGKQIVILIFMFLYLFIAYPIVQSIINLFKSLSHYFPKNVYNSI